MRAVGSVGEGLIEISLDQGTARPAIGFGGDAANVCVMAARLGAPARICGRVGSDGLGDRLTSYWRREGIDVSTVRADDRCPTGLYVNERTAGDEHRFVYYRDNSAGSHLEPDDLTEAFYSGLDAVVITGVTLAISASAAAAAETAISRASALGIRTACVVNYRPSLGGHAAALAAVAAKCDLVIASAEDSAAVFNATGPQELVAALNGDTSEVVLSSGAEGAVAIADREVVFQAAPRVAVKNASGAGDALAGAYLSQRVVGRCVGDALAWAVAASSLSVQRDGCASSYPDEREVRQQLRRLPPPERRGR